jgi:hypothetical protein
VQRYGAAVQTYRAHPLKGHLSYANVISTLALFIALGGASYAATSLSRDSVGTPQIRQGAVTLPKLGLALASSSAQAGGPQIVRGFEGSCLGGVPGGPAPPCVPPLPVRLVSTSITFRQRANLLVLATSVAGSAARPEQATSVQLAAIVDHGSASSPGSPHGETALAPRSDASASLVVMFPNVGPGRHVVELIATAGQTSVSMSGTQVIAVALPRG